MEEGKTTYRDRDGKITVHGTFNFEGTLGELNKIINNTIEEYGEDTKCKLDIFGSFPHRWSPSLILIDGKNDN